MKDKPRRFVKMFKPRFAELIRSGAKRQTIRPTPKVLPEAGDIIDCRQWSGLPYRSKQIRLGEFEVAEVGSIKITGWSVSIRFGPVFDQMLEEEESIQEFSKADGFESYDEMRDWFLYEHGLPFEGILIKWRDL